MLNSQLGAPKEVENNGPMVVSVLWFLLAMSAVFVTLRIYARTRDGKGIRNLWWDDWLCVAAQFTLTIMGINTYYNMTIGWGKHVYDIPVNDMPSIVFIRYLNAAFNILASALSKTSFAMSLFKVSRDVPSFGWMKKILLFSIISVNLFLGGAIIAIWTRCTPTEKTWKPWIEGICGSRLAHVSFGAAACVYAGGIDFVLAILPWWLVPLMRITRREKIAVGVAMSMGMIAGVASCLKGAYALDFSKKDFSFEGFNLIFWSIFEVTLSIMATCTPMMRVLLKDCRIVVWLLGATKADKSSDDSAPCVATFHMRDVGDDEAVSKAEKGVVVSVRPVSSVTFMTEPRQP